jgi:hypothetical protein
MTLSNEQADEAASRPGRRPIFNAVNRLLKSLDLDPAGEVRAELARNIARRLDSSVDLKAGTVAQAASGLSKELQSLLVSLVDPSKDVAAFDLISNIFKRAGDS